MTDSYLVRMVRDANAARRVVGEVEVVATGERVRFRDSDELLAIIATEAVRKSGVANTDATSVEGAPDA
jgi:hypothetical protein